MSAAFRAFRVFDEGGKVQGRVVEASLGERDGEPVDARGGVARRERRHYGRIESA